MWWRQAALLFLGWIVVGSFLARGNTARPLVLIGTGLLFSVLTASALSRIFRPKAEAPLLGTPPLPEGNTFAHPPALRRWIRLALVIWPVGLVGTYLAFRANLVDRSLFMISMVVYGFFFLLTLYVVPRAMIEVRISEAGLDVRLALGRRASIPWEEIENLEPSRGFGGGSRLRTKSGFSLTLDSSLPGYASLVALIRAHLDAR